jgi:hypothetical protein
MEFIELSDNTLQKLRELREQIIVEDVTACEGKESDIDIVYFWNDDRLIDFMTEIVRFHLGNRIHAGNVRDPRSSLAQDEIPKNYRENFLAGKDDHPKK